MIRYQVLYSPDRYMEVRSCQMVSELSLAVDMLDKPCSEYQPISECPNNLMEGDSDNGAHERFFSLNFIYICFLLKVFI
jgi:hypothetical protein